MERTPGGGGGVSEPQHTLWGSQATRSYITDFEISGHQPPTHRCNNLLPHAFCRELPLGIRGNRFFVLYCTIIYKKVRTVLKEGNRVLEYANSEKTLIPSPVQDVTKSSGTPVCRG